MSLPWPVTLLVVIGAFVTLFFTVKWVLSAFAHQCPSGQQPDSVDKTKCVPICSGSQFFDRQSNTCRDCPLGLVLDDNGNCVVQCPDAQTWCDPGKACITAAYTCLDSGICANDLVDPVKKTCGNCPSNRKNLDGTCCSPDQLFYGGRCCDLANQKMTKDNVEVCCTDSKFSEKDGCCSDAEQLHDGLCKIQCIDPNNTQNVDWCDPVKEECRNGRCFTKGCEFTSANITGRMEFFKSMQESDGYFFACKPQSNETIIFDLEKGPWRTCGPAGGTTQTWTSTTRRSSDDDKPCTQKDCFSLNNYEGLASVDYKENASKADDCTALYNCNLSTGTKEKSCGECPLANSTNDRKAQCCMIGTDYSGLVCSDGMACVTGSDGRGFRCVPSMLAKQCTDYETQGCQNGGKMIPCSYTKTGADAQMDAHCDCDNLPGLHDAYGINNNGNCLNDGGCPAILHFRDGQRCEGGIKLYDRTVLQVDNDQHFGDINAGIYNNSMNIDQINSACKSNSVTATGTHGWGNNQHVSCVVCGDFPAARGGNPDEITVANLCGFGGNSPRTMPQK